MSIFSKIRGTIEQIFQIGLGGPQIKNNAGAVELRNSDDTDFTIVRGATPVGDNDLVTKAYLGDQLVTGSVRSVRLELNTDAVQESIKEIPANAVVLRARVNITTAYSAGTTITVGRTSNVTLLQATTDNLATVVGVYEVPQETLWGGTANVVEVNVDGTPLAGEGFVVVEYTQPDAYRPPFSSSVLSSLTPIGGQDSEDRTQNVHVSPTTEGVGLIVTNREILDKLDQLLSVNIEIRDLLLKIR